MFDITLLTLLAAGVLMLLSFFFSGSEAGFLSLNRERFYSDLKQGNKNARSLERYVAHMPAMLMTCLLANNLVNIALVATTRKVWVDWFGNEWLGLYLVLSTIVFLIAGDVVPKMVYIKHSNAIIYRTAFLIRFFYRILAPLTQLLLRVASPVIDRLFKGLGDSISRKDFKEIVGDVHRQGELSESERTFLENFSYFSQTRISEIMTPLIDLYVVHKKTTVKSLLDQLEDELDFVPVYEKRVDDIVGYLEVEDVFYSANNKKSITEYIKTPIYIPESITLDRIFSHLLDYRNELIVVIDEHGGCSGLVSWKNILDNLFGFKYDISKKKTNDNIRKLAEGRYEIDSGIDIDTFNNMFKKTIHKEGFETLGGFLNHLCSAVPTKDSMIHYENLTFTVLRGSRTAVDLVEMEINVQSSATKDVDTTRTTTISGNGAGGAAISSPRQEVSMPKRKESPERKGSNRYSSKTKKSAITKKSNGHNNRSIKKLSNPKK